MSKLWSALRSGDKDAFIELYDKFYQRLYIYGFKIARNKELVKDCIQDMFLEIWKKRDNLPKVESLELDLQQKTGQKVKHILNN